MATFLCHNPSCPNLSNSVYSLCLALLCVLLQYYWQYYKPPSAVSSSDSMAPRAASHMAAPCGLAWESRGRSSPALNHRLWCRSKLLILRPLANGNPLQHSQTFCSCTESNNWEQRSVLGPRLCLFSDKPNQMVFIVALHAGYGEQ